jgi:hypothetical protein
VPRYGGRARALASIDVTALAVDCVDVILMPEHNHVERVVVTGLRSYSGVNATLHARPDRTLRDRVCRADGPVVYMTNADSRSPVGLLVVEAEGAPPEPVSTPDAGVAERAACLAAPTEPGCDLILQGMIHGVQQPIAPRAALEATRARCDESDPASCVLYAENLYALGDPASDQAAYLLLEQAGAVGDARALELRAELTQAAPTP